MGYRTRLHILLAGGSWVTHSIHMKGFDSFTTSDYEEGIRTLVESAVPVEVNTGDDRVEAPQGAILRAICPEHVVLQGTGPDSPALLGNNRVVARSDVDILVECQADPLNLTLHFASGATPVAVAEPGEMPVVETVDAEHLAKDMRTKDDLIPADSDENLVTPSTGRIAVAGAELPTKNR